jgi:LuxR family maltose regulon positive regulatory protein
VIILESKLSVPDQTPHLIRNRLYSYLENHLDRSLICLTSGGGYGKTTLIANFVRDKHIPAIWYQLSHQDRNLHIFLTYMKTALYRIKFGTNLIYDIAVEKMEEEMENIIALLSHWPTRLVIVLDHYQSVDQCEEVESVLNRMIAHASPLITFIITSRVRPNLQLSNLKLQNKLVELRTNDLAFTKEEIFRFFVQLHDVTLHEHEVDLIYQKTEGWVTSLKLLQDVIKEMSEAERSSFWLKFNGTPDIYDYLGTETLASQSQEMRHFLYKTCLLSDLNSSVINKYLGISDSDQILEHLLKHHLFIYKTNSGTIKYHHLFRSFLYKELSKRYQAEIEDLHKKLSHIYEQRGDMINSFIHSVAGGDFLNVAKLMKNMKERFNHSQFLTLIEKFSENFPQDISTASTSLFLIRYIPPNIVQDLIASLESHIKCFKENQNPVLLIRAQHQLATIYFYIGEMKKAEQLCESSLHKSVNINDDHMISENLSLISLIYWNTGRHEESIHIAQQLLSSPVTIQNFHSHCLALWVLAEINLKKNDLWRAEPLLKETFKLSEQRFNHSIIYHYCSMGKYYRLLGKYEESIEWIKKGEQLALNLNLEYDLGWIYIELVQTYLEMGQWKDAEYYISKAGGCLTLHNFYFTCKIKQLKIKLWHFLGKHQLAFDAEKELKSICKEKNIYWLFPETSQPTIQKQLIVRDKQPAKLFIYVLGSFEIKSAHGSIVLKRKSSLRLLQYLISHRESKVTKDSIIHELFPEGSTKTVHNHFHVALSYLRKALEPDLKTGRDSRFIKQSGEHFSLQRDHIYLDIDEFTELVCHHDEESAPAKRIERLKKAELLYRGKYFEGYPYVRFLESEREKFRDLFLDVLQYLADYYFNIGDVKQGIHYYEKALKEEPYKETIYIDYMKRLVESGLHIQSKKVSERYQKRIENEMGLPAQTKCRNFISH